MSENIENYDQSPHYQVGVFEVEITPPQPFFLHGYPHVDRISEGINDHLLASAMCISDGNSEVVFVGCDLIFVTQGMVRRARQMIEQRTGLPGRCIMITATHTHSGPVIVNLAHHDEDNVEPKPDAEVIEFITSRIVDAAVGAIENKQTAVLRYGEGDMAGLGTNRRDPEGPSIKKLPVLIAESNVNHKIIGVMAVCAMHPTVLHEDSRMISGDFPGLARSILKEKVLSEGVFVYHMGAAGNQSPRHVVKANNMEEAKRLGKILADQICDVINSAEVMGHVCVDACMDCVALPVRELPSVGVAKRASEDAKEKLDLMRKSGEAEAEIRTAECDWFGAEEILGLTYAAQDGRLEHAVAMTNPAEIQLFRIGDSVWGAWPAEVFVEFAIACQAYCGHINIMTCANGEMQGYLVTTQAIQEGGYEACNAIYASPESGERLVAITNRLYAGLMESEVGHGPCASN
ncbi:neutral/alkaline non-lysosomal ceramidase N-terminal domain-containing protein [Poriferisphaera sp. WC338]|uniref:neutral/alkaline non-lysosomal ceramidase N-terminal domain-containing protein n=1 Tax=Poriferisphaera sp. WC338 TaxID=3425129 RepID=UPI003D81336C